MAHFRGQDGFVATGGVLVGSPKLTAALAAAATTMGISAATLLGVVMPGDTFTITGEAGSPVHTVTSAALVAAGNAIAGINFTPGIAAGGAAINDPVVFAANAMGEVKGWSLNAQLQLLDASVMGNSWKVNVGGQASWTGQVQAHLDYGDPRQKALIDAMLTPNPQGASGTLILGIGSTATTLKQWYGAAVFKQGQIQSQLNNLVVITFDFEGAGPTLPNWI